MIKGLVCEEGLCPLQIMEDKMLLALEEGEITAGPADTLGHKNHQLMAAQKGSRRHHITGSLPSKTFFVPYNITGSLLFLSADFSYFRAPNNRPGTII